MTGKDRLLSSTHMIPFSQSYTYPVVTFNVSSASLRDLDELSVILHSNSQWLTRTSVSTTKSVWLPMMVSSSFAALRWVRDFCHLVV